MALAAIVTTYETSGVVVTAIFDMLPYESNSLYIARFKDARFDDLRAFLQRQAGVEGVEMITQARLDLRRVDDSERFDLPILVVCDASLPASNAILADDVRLADPRCLRRK